VNRTVWFAVLVLFSVLGVSASAPDPVPYPADFRTWTFVKSGPSAARGGVHHIFANERAMDGYKTGRFPDGAVIVFDLIATTDMAAMPKDGPRKLVDVMVKDSVKYAATGGWGFEEFLGDSQTNRVLNEQSQQACFACHTQWKDRDYVFSSVSR
jgi:hypothetical protein